MKRELLLLAVVLFGFFLLAGQISAQPDIDLGIKAGLNLANFSGDDAQGLDVKTGIAVGAFMGVNFPGGLTIQPEALYSMKGSKDEGMGIELKFEFDYLEIPVLLKYSIPTPGMVKPALFFGPAVGILLKGDITLSIGDQSGTLDAKDYLKSTDFGLVFGGGVDFSVGKGKIITDIRYTLGLSTVDDGFGELIEWPQELDLKNSVISLQAGYSFL